MSSNLNSKSHLALMSKYEDSEANIFGTKNFLSEATPKVVNRITTKDMEDNFSTWVGYYRKFPHKFAEDFLNINLKPFQQYLLYEMMQKDNIFFAAGRGNGKTFLVAVAALCMMILYPNLKIVCSASVKSQGFQILSKVDEIRSMSNLDLLDFEIEEKLDSLNTQKPNLKMFNGSRLWIVSSSENSRGYRSHVLLLDEAILLDPIIYETVLRRFQTNLRTPPYLKNPKYAHLQESNKTIFMTSVKSIHNWSYAKYKTYLERVRKYGKKSNSFSIALPYQMSIMSGFLSKSQLEEEMMEDDFSIEAFSEEMLAFWSDGGAQNAYFSYDKLTECRTLPNATYSRFLRNEINNKEILMQKRKPEEIRIVSFDVALMGGKKKHKNDNSVLTYTVAYPNKSRQYFIKETQFIESISGGIPIEYHSRRIREVFLEYDCDYIVLDTNGLGLTIYNDLVKEYYHQELGMTMPAYACMNDDTMNDLIPNKGIDLDKVIYSFKATSQLNKDMYSQLQSDILRKRLKLLVDDKQADLIFSKNKSYPEWRFERDAIYKQILSPHVETNKLINEMINLELKDEDKLKLVEQNGMRKDRVSSLAMGNYFISTLEDRLFSKKTFDWSKYCATSTSSSYKRELY